MLVAAALVPPTALLVPGAAGRAEVLAQERAAAVTAVADVLALGADRVLLVVGTDPDRAGPPWVRPPASTHRARFSLGAAGVPGPGGSAEPAVAVGQWLLDRAGHRGEVELVLAPADVPGEHLRALGERAAGSAPVAVVAVGGLSARRGEDAPLPTDPRAAALDEAMVAWWAGTGPAVEGPLARELAASAWGPLQVLDGMPTAVTAPEVRLLSCPFGATYLVATRLPRTGA